MLRERIDRFFRDYATAFGALDPRRIASFYAPPCAFVNPVGRSMVDSPEALVQYFSRVTSVHRRSEWSGASASVLRVTEHGGHFADVQVRWRVAGRDGNTLWDFEHGYLLSVGEAQVRIVAAIGY